MPKKDRTGPTGAGSMTGRSLGLCADANAARHGAGSGKGSGPAYRRGFGRGFAVKPTSPKTQKDLLHEQKAMLQKRLEVIDMKLESL